MPIPEVQRRRSLRCHSIRFITLGVIAASISSTSAQQAPVPRPLVTQYCVGCHNQEAKLAGISLEGLDPSKPGDNAGIWEKVLRKVSAGQMPPTGMPHPSAAASSAFTKALAEEL